MSTLVPNIPTGKPEAPEREVIAILLMWPALIGPAIESGLDPGDILAPHYAAACEAIVALFHDGQAVTAESVYARMAAQNTAHLLAFHGDMAHLCDLQNSAASPDGLRDFIAAVKRAAIERHQAMIREELERPHLSEERRRTLAELLEELTAERDALLARAEGWMGEPGPPIPLDDSCVPPWPDGVLSPPLSEYVDAVAEFVQVPRDMAGMVALGVLSTCWAGKVCAVPYDGYTEQLSLYCVAAADVGERKSATYARFEAPIREHEAERRAALSARHSDHSADKAGLEAELAKAIQRRKTTEKGSDEYADACDAARHLQRERDELRPPPRAEFLTQDCTAEGLARLMSETGGFAVLMNPEGGGIFDILAGRYNDLPNLDVFLKSYDAERLVIHRANREREYPPIERPALVIAVTTQPATLRRLAERRELDERGLVARMIFAIPSSSRVGYREAYKPPIPSGLCDAYHQAVLQALRLERPDMPHELRFSDEALAEYRALFVQIEQRLRPDGDLYPMRGWGCKLLGKIVRIAALLHLMECGRHAEPWSAPVSGDAFGRASLLTGYLIAHARRTFGLMKQSPHVEGARKLLAALHRDRQHRFTMRYAHRIIARNDRKEVVRPVLALLCTHNIIARTTGKRIDSEAWLVNPRLVREWASQAAPRQAGMVGTVGTV